MVSLMASFVLSFFPIDVLDEIWDLIESVSEGFLTYSLIKWESSGGRKKFIWLCCVKYNFCNYFQGSR